MIGMSLLILAVFIFTVAIVVAITEGAKITLAGFIGFFSLSWAFLLSIWSGWVEFVIEPALSWIIGDTPTTLLTVSQVMVFLSWVFVIAVAVAVIFWTSQRGAPRPYA